MQKGTEKVPLFCNGRVMCDDDEAVVAVTYSSHCCLLSSSVITYVFTPCLDLLFLTIILFSSVGRG